MQKVERRTNGNYTSNNYKSIQKIQNKGVFIILDAHNQFSDSQALTATAASTNIIDFGADRNIGIGEKLSAIVNIEVASDFTTGNETYVIGVETDDNSSFSSPAVLSTTTLVGSVAAGTIISIPIPADLRMERYLRLNYTLGGTTPSVTLSAHLMPSNNGVEVISHYADGLTIS